MKLTFILLFAALMQVYAVSRAQNVTLSEKNAPLDKILKDIKRQTGVRFLYNPEMMQKAKSVTIQVTNKPLSEALDICFTDQPLSYQIYQGNIIVKEKEKFVLNKISPVSSVPITILGKVVDEISRPLPGATVKAKGDKVMVTTNEKGEFTINISNEATPLIVSYIGFETKEFVINPHDNLQIIRLIKGTSKLDEVHVVAYGETTERFNVGSISKVSAKEIEEQPITNPLQALEGRVPGLVVTQSSGVPGASLQIQIRGQNSLNPAGAGNKLFDSPLFIIDGVPFTTQNANINQNSSLALTTSTNSAALGNKGISPFNSINPTDIENIEVLRDADATAIYGSRGSNGVILITTKKGKAGKTMVSGNVWTGESQVTHSIPMMNTQQYLQMRREAMKNDGIIPKITNAPDLLLYDTTRYTDWKQYLIGGKAHTTDANASISGGTQNDQFLIGTGYHHESYIYPGNFGEDRASVNVNFHHNSVDRKLSMDFSANYSYDQNNSSSNTNVTSSFTLAPNYPDLHNPNGTLNWNYKGADLQKNPLGYLNQPYSLKNYNLISHFQVNYQIFSGLTLRSSFGYNTLNSNEYNARPIASQDPAHDIQSSAGFATNNFQTWIIEPQAEYKRKIGEGKLDILMGGTFQQNINKSMQINASDYSNDVLLGSISGAATTTANGASYLYKYNAIFGRINYIWDSKYIINMTGRRDGSSRFGPGRQFGNFGSVGSGWLFSDEPFVKNVIPSLSYGKLRASYGTTGNDNIGDYQYLSAYAPLAGVSYRGIVGYDPQNLYNPDYSWAVTKKLEFGLEMGFFNDRILVNINYFRNRSGNQLVAYTLPFQTGFTTVTQNAPYTVQNTGWEIQLSSTNVKTKRFNWNTSFNISIPKNTLLSFPDIARSSYSTVYIVGQPLSVLQGFKYAGVNESTGLFQYQSASGLTSKPKNYIDYNVIGNLDPKFYGGLVNTFTYGDFQLGIFLQFSKQLGANYIGQVYAASLSPGFVGVNIPAPFLSRWQKSGDQSDFQQFSSSFKAAYTSANDFVRSSGAYSDASFIRLKTLSLSYNLPASIFKKLGSQGCRLYVNAQNIFTITNYLGNDPENRSFYSLPTLKTVVAGIQFTF